MRVSLSETKIRHREEGHIRMEVDGVILPQTRQYQKPSESGIGKKGFSPRSIRGSMVLSTL